MAHKTYPNHVLENEFEDQYESKLDLMQFCEVDDSLVGVPGDKVIINTYTATNGTETLKMGEGNTKSIEVSYESQEYEIELLQNKFEYYDEEEERDPKIVDKGIEHMAVDMFNTSNRKAIAEFAKAVLKVEVEKFDFNAFVDGVALFKDETGLLKVFCLINGADVAEVRKELKEDLKYITDYVRTGYIGTVNGVNLYTSNIATAGEPILATKKAVKYFSKKGTEVEQERDADHRKNTMYSRKSGLFAFANATQAVKLVKVAATEETQE